MSVNIEISAFAMFITIQKLTFISYPIGIEKSSFACPVIIKPIASIFISVMK
jgi:hypothetical protein